MSKIITYFPGSGGSRLKNKLLLKEYQLAGRVYDNKYADYRYLLDDYYKSHKADDILQLHCMNMDLIRSYFPEAYVYMIRSDFKSALMRYWSACGKNNNNFKNILDSAFTCIAWHVDYYKQYPVQESADEYIDINDSTEFGQIMLNEFNNSTNEIFELAWSIFYEQGPTAPIIDIWEQLYDKK